MRKSFLVSTTSLASIGAIGAIFALGISQPASSLASQQVQSIPAIQLAQSGSQPAQGGQTTPPQQPPADYPHHGMMPPNHPPMHHRDGGMRMHGGMPFDESMWGDGLQKKLALTEDQQKRWAKAKEFSANQRKAMFQEHRQHRDAMQQALKSDNPDLRALVKDHQKKRQEHQKQMDSVMDAWLDVYDALSADQKKIVRQHLLEAMEQRGERGRRAR